MSYLQKRIISRLDIKGSRLIKGIRFEGLRVLGNPSDKAINYYKEGIDEIFYSDAVASLYSRNSLDDLLRKTCQSVFVPVTAGGAIKSIEDVYLLLKAGADKIAINTHAVKKPDLITTLANRFGEQCIVLSIQARRSLKMNSGWEVMIEAGRERTGIDLQFWIEKSQKLGIGEIFLTSVDQDGTNKGPDKELINMANKIVLKPLIVGGGISSLNSIREILMMESVSGVAIGSALHRDKLKIDQIKEETKSDHIKLRYNKIKLNHSQFTKSVISKEVAIIDYGMGNQQSLVNALNLLGHKVTLTSKKDQLKNSEVVILPGVGSFPAGIRELKNRDLKEVILERHLQKRALIGICLGMQLLFEDSSEFELSKGLGIFKGNIKSLDKHKVISNDYKLNPELIKLPHMGWNELANTFGIKKYIESDLKNNFFYFVHSYGAQEVKNADFYVTTSYFGREPIAICGLENTIGFQFHPERSGEVGLNLLSKTIDNVILDK